MNTETQKLRDLSNKDPVAAWTSSSFARGYLNSSHRIPPYMEEGLARWIMLGVKPGDFLCAVLCNDLMGAAGKADDVNVKLLNRYCVTLYNYAPSGSYGSAENFKRWHEAGGVVGLVEGATNEKAA